MPSTPMASARPIPSHSSLSHAERRVRVVALDRIRALANDMTDVQIFRERVGAAQVDDGRERGDPFEDLPVADVLTRRPSGVACSMVRFSSQM